MKSVVEKMKNISNHLVSDGLLLQKGAVSELSLCEWLVLEV